MTRRLLVTGLGGFVAGSVIAQGREAWSIDAISSPNHSLSIEGVRCHSLDLRDSDRLEELFKACSPNAVIHAAAKADIDFCEKNPAEAEEINVGVTQTLAECCDRLGAKMVFCSTDTVFDGAKGHYTEEDHPRPVNLYGETKVRAEEIVLGKLKDSVVARLALVMGFPVHGSGNSFLFKTIASLKEGKEVKFPENEIRTPIDVVTLGQALLELAGHPHAGIFHLAGNTRLNRYEMGREIARHLGFTTDLIISTDSNAMPGRAPRPNDASLDNSKAWIRLETKMKDLIEGLDHAVQFKEQYHG
ncbi:MAG: SDR family oxidoreductase [Candidatus Omnitrophica bacterium]|nr:SDR family oxidoreductase [Candidatus Omnitrophota bacterium]